MYKHLKAFCLTIVVLLVLFVNPKHSNSYIYNHHDILKDFGPRLVSYSLEDFERYKQMSSQDWALVTSTASLLMLHEGFSSIPYRDTNGNWTQGYGRHIGVKKPKNVSEAKAREWLYEDIKDVIQALDEKIPWWRKCNAVRQQVLINFAYNVGVNGLDKFDKFLAAIEKRQYTKASKELLYNGAKKTKYFKQVGVRAEHLAHAIKTGKWNMEVIKSYYG